MGHDLNQTNPHLNNSVLRSGLNCLNVGLFGLNHVPYLSKPFHFLQPIFTQPHSFTKTFGNQSVYNRCSKAVELSPRITNKDIHNPNIFKRSLKT